MIRLLRLSCQEWRWLLAAIVLLPATALSIKASGWVETMRRCTRVLGLDNAVRADRQSAPAPAKVARMVRIAATYGPFRVKCLPRAIVLWSMLRHDGVAAELRLGVRHGDRGFEAHAWVEVGGLPLDEQPEAVPFVPLGAPAALLR